MRSINLTPKQYQILRTMSLIGSCNLTEVARIASLNPGSMTYYTKPLREQGLIANQGYTYWVTIKGQGVLESGTN